MVTEADVRARLTKRLRGALTDREWDFLTQHRHVEEALNSGPGELDGVLQATASLVREMRAVYPDVEPAGSTSPDATLAPTSA